MDDDSETKTETALLNEMSTVDCQQLDEAELIAIKGDTIGDTVYSAKWIINTLITLSKVYDDGWSESLEDNLCMLWDMTVEKDIVQFLIDNNFIQIARFTIEISKEPRLTELVLGIVGNMCCQPIALEAVANDDDLVSSIFGLLSTDDSETLVQIVRLLQCAVWDVQKNEQTKWYQHFGRFEFFGDAITFILKNSTNDDLLIASTDLLQSMTNVPIGQDDCLLFRLFKVDRLMPALVESFLQLVPTEGDVHHSYTNLKFMDNWLTVLWTILQSKFEIFSRDDKDDNLSKIMNILWKILQPYRYSRNLLPLDEKAAACIHNCVEIISSFQRNGIHLDAKINYAIVAIMHQLQLAVKRDSQADAFTESNETIVEFVKYLETYWLNVLRLYEDSQLVEIFEMCDDAMTNSLTDFAQKNGRVN